VLAAAATAVVLAGCGSSTSLTGGGNNGFAGDELGTPIAMPALDLTDTADQPYDLASELKGHLTLLYFGYTHCPDICPTTMADLGAAIRSLPKSEADKVQVVFVTSDPARDTPAVMKAWLANFDQGVPLPFIGLTGTVKEIDAGAAKLGIYLEPPVKEKDGTIEVTHGAQTLAFSGTDQKAHLVWTPGTTVKQYAHDIKRLESGVL